MDRGLFQEEHNIFRQAFRRFCEQEIVPHQEAWMEAGIVPRELWTKAGAQGFLCPEVREEYGGAGADFLYSVVIIEELARIGESGFAASLHSDVVVPYLDSFGSEAQKQRYLPGCVRGETISAIAMTEPGTGSDLAAIQTTAIDQGDHYLLNGAKTFISNGILADLIVVVAKTDPKAEPPHAGVSLLLVDADRAGVERGRNLKKMGMKAQDTAELFFHDVRVPKENLLGDAGAGFYYLMTKLQQERLVVAVAAADAMFRAYRNAETYARERKAFGRPIHKFQHLQFELVDMYTYATVARTFVDKCIAEHMAGANIVSEVSMAKWWVTEMLGKVCDTAVQIHGGYGYMLEYPVARDYLDARVQRIYAGTNEIMKLIIAKQLGL